ncbi:MAG: hypothetical protein R8J85_06725 [Mariprofundales bacterium]
MHITSIAQAKREISASKKTQYLKHTVMMIIIHSEVWLQPRQTVDESGTDESALPNKIAVTTSPSST